MFLSLAAPKILFYTVNDSNANRVLLHYEDVIMRTNTMLPSINLTYGEFHTDTVDSTLISFHEMETGIDALREWTTSNSDNDLVNSFTVTVVIDKLRESTVVLTRTNATTGQVTAMGHFMAIQQLVTASD